MIQSSSTRLFMKRPSIVPLPLGLVFLLVLLPFVQGAGSADEIAAALAPLRTYDYGQSRAVPDALDRLVRESHGQPVPRAQLESALVTLLEADLSLAAQQEICRRLAIIGTDQSVPALARMLAHKDGRVAEAACYALAGNPSPAATAALRHALTRANGAGLVAVINLLGNRRDSRSDQDLAALARGREGEIADPAIGALGKIATDSAVQTLRVLRASQNPLLRRTATLALLQAASELASRGRPIEARAIYRELSGSAELPQVRRGALVGQLLLSGPDKVDLIGSVFQGGDAELQRVAIAAIATSTDRALARAVAARLPALKVSDQVLLIEALATFRDPEVCFALVEAAQHSELPTRAAALRALGTAGNASVISLLVERAGSPLTGEAQAATDALRRLQGPTVDEALLNHILRTPPDLRSRLIRVLAERKATHAVPALLIQAEQPDERVCRAAFRALGVLASEQDLPAMLRALKDLTVESARADAEAALAQVIARVPDSTGSTEAVRNMMATAPPTALKCSLLRLLSVIGSEKACQTVAMALRDSNAEVKDTALRTLSDWPDARPLPVLLDVAGSDGSELRRTLALRGYLRLLKEVKAAPEELVRHYRLAIPLVRQPAEKRLLLSGLATVAQRQALQWAMGFLSDTSLRPEAEQAVIALARQLGRTEREAVKAALQQVITSSTDRGRRLEAMASLPPPPLPNVYLDSLTPVKARSGNVSGHAMVNRNCVGGPLRMKGTVYTRGIGEHAQAELVYALKPEFKHFVALIGLDDQVARFNDIRGSSVVRVYADQTLLAETPVLRGAGACSGVDVEIPRGAGSLRVVVEDAGDGVDFDDVDLANAGFTTVGSLPVEKTE